MMPLPGSAEVYRIERGGDRQAHHDGLGLEEPTHYIFFSGRRREVNQQPPMTRLAVHGENPSALISRDVLSVIYA
jgi:hypothetical protein